MTSTASPGASRTSSSSVSPNGLTSMIPEGAPAVGPKRPTSGTRLNSAGSTTKPKMSTPMIATT
jgi:hypothetical protein